MDYVFVSVDPAITHDPWPDLLDELRLTLNTHYNIPTEWKVGKGPDHSRRMPRIHFQADSFTQAEALLPKLSTFLNAKRYCFQCSFVSKAMNRVTFDLLDRKSINNLFMSPPVIDHQPLYPSTPHYIQPLYALEVAILGVQDVLEHSPLLTHTSKPHRRQPSCPRWRRVLRCLQKLAADLSFHL